jgi:hypothetical protein
VWCSSGGRDLGRTFAGCGCVVVGDSWRARDTVKTKRELEFVCLPQSIIIVIWQPYLCIEGALREVSGKSSCLALLEIKLAPQRGQTVFWLLFIG